MLLKLFLPTFDLIKYKNLLFFKLSMIVHTCNPKIQEVEVRGLPQVQGQAKLCNKY